MLAGLLLGGRANSTPSCPVFVDSVVRHLFPEHADRPAGTGLIELIEVTDPQDISEDELRNAARKTPIREVHGLDRVPGLAIKAAALNAPDHFRRTFSACLQEGCFRTQWKVHTLVFLPKGNKPSEDPSSCRPRCLLGIAGKLFE